MHRPPRIALATAPHIPDLTADDRLLLDELRRRGADAVPAVWDAPLDWSAFDTVVVRSCWDSHLRRDAFLAWTERVAATRARLLNAAPLLRWNTDKRYLRELERAGVRIVPTAWVEPSAAEEGAPTLAETLAAQGWDEAVVKPAISAGAHETWRTSVATAADSGRRFARLLQPSYGAVMVQPLVREVIADGEWSLIFLAGRFSHAVVKRPAAGDFRVQYEHGGSATPTVPTDALVADASAVVTAAAAATGLRADGILYARVDGIAREGRLLLMELECTEPSLFFAEGEGAAARLADTLVRAGASDAAA